MKTITVDACSLCQLHCVRCPATQMGYRNTIGKGYITIENFASLVKQNPSVKHFEFDCYGELFLNPDLQTIMEYAHKKKIMLSSHSGVNMNNVSKQTLRDLCAYRFQFLNISIDGTRRETYSKYRVGGNFDTVMVRCLCLGELL